MKIPGLEIKPLLLNTYVHLQIKLKDTVIPKIYLRLDPQIQLKRADAAKTYFPFNHILSSLKFGLAITVVLACICKIKRIFCNHNSEISNLGNDRFYSFSALDSDVTAIVQTNAKNALKPVDSNSYQFKNVHDEP
jgi:hypothetical protein